MATGIAIVAAFLLGLRLGLAIGHRSEARKRDLPARRI
jgi:hypothetical protein